MVKKICAPTYVQIEITKSCNYNCIYCYNFWEKKRTPIADRKISKENIGLIMDQITLNKIPSITITGGEPFINKEVIFFILETAKKNGVVASINTNFSLVKKEDLLKIAKDFKKTSFLVSLPSADEQEYKEIVGIKNNSYYKVIENIKFALELGLKVNVNMVLIKKNLKSLRKTAELSKQLGVSNFCGTKMLPNVSLTKNDLPLSEKEAIESINELVNISRELKISVDILGCFPKCLLVKSDAFNRFKNRFCTAGCTTLTIGTDGNVRPCSHVNKSYGNIFIEPLKEIWDKMDSWKNNEFVPKECGDCSVLEICRGGCRVNNANNNIYAVDDYAEINYFKNNNFKGSEINKETNININLVNEFFIVNPIIKFREETFGSLIFGNSEKLIIQFLNKKASSFLFKNQTQKSEFSTDDFMENSGAKNSFENSVVAKLFLKLLKKEIIIKNRKEV